MAYRFPARKLIVICCAATLGLSACAAPQGSSTTESSMLTPAEITLRERSAAMQKTIVEAVALGGVAGLAARLLLQNANNNRVTNLGFGGFFTIGAAAGAVAGTYVAHLQNNFANQEQRISAMRADLAANLSETEATLQVMRVVLSNQQQELRRLQAAVNAGTADSASLAREIAESQANLTQMDAAASGAVGRFNEFSDARNQVGSGTGLSAVDQDLARLSNQISQMRGVAENLAGQL